MKLINAIWLAALVCMMPALAQAAAKSQEEHPAAFVTVKGTHFARDNRPYYVVGSNMWYGGYLGANTKVGDRKRLVRELDKLRAMGINNLRVLAVSEKSTLNSAVHPATTNGFREYDESLIAGLDFLLAEMGKRGMTAVLYLNNFWQWSGGMTQYMAWVDGQPAQDPNVTNDYEAFMARSAAFYQSARAQDEFKKTIARIVSRVNTITGKPYSSDPAIMSWQLANEPRPGNSKTTPQQKEIYRNWIADTAKYIHSLDRNHLVSIGSEGEMGSANDMALWAGVHESPDVDYMTFHLWIRNWGWYDQHKPDETWASGLAKAKAYLDTHIDTAKKVGKPLVLEEFGLDRDGGAYDVKSTTRYRDKYYREVFDLVYKRARAGDPVAGYNFWAWNGSARTTRPDFWWHDGDDFMGDPPQEQQGMYGVFDTDISTIGVIREYANKMHALSRR
jgi:mannan endo-1,4-beta-mannosidase